jgi:predicted membrane GTPase involved in stress response
MGLIEEFQRIKREDGLEDALKSAEIIKISLEEIREFGDEDEQIPATFLLIRIRKVIQDLQT